MTTSELFTASGVRLRQRTQRSGDLNWLFLPGGPGIGSESLYELAETLDVPGTMWMVDLPGDGSNIAPPGAGPDPFAQWPQVLVEAAQMLPNSIYVGHSTGGMYLLSVPEVERHILGLALISTAPNASWRSAFFAMTESHLLPEVQVATQMYEAEPTPERLRDLAVASAEWNFTPRTVEAGREFLGRMPYNPAAVAWSDRAFDSTYTHTWWPHSLPTLILGGTEDRIVVQNLWEHPEFQGAHILHRRIAHAAHFPWFDEPEAVRSAFLDLAKRVAYS